MTETTHKLTQRMEALEKAPTKGKGTHETVNKLERGCHNDTCIGHLDALAVSIADLETRFQSFSSDLAAQMGTCTTALAELGKQTCDGPSSLTEKDLQACIQSASGHVLRLEKLSEKWNKLKVQGDSGSVDQFQETIRDQLPAEQFNNTKMRTGCDSHSMQERASQVGQQEANGGHRLPSPRSGQAPCFVHLQPASIPPVVLTPHTAPVTPRSPLLPCSIAPFPVLLWTPRQELSRA